jgi:hypothetical protein
MPTPRQYANQAERQAAYRRRLAAARRAEQEAKGMPALPAVPTIPGHPRWHALIQHALLLLGTAQEEMQAYYAQRSERWQESERGEAFLERLQALQETHSAVEELTSAQP